MIKNLIFGVSKGYRHRLKLVGVGFKAAIKEKDVFLKIGFSHEVVYTLPNDIEGVVSKTKGSYLLLKGIEKTRVQQTAKEIRSLRMPDAYKGKGIHYQKEILKLKKGKREGK
jgi:large subunit ribosomal protein L6